MTALTGASFVFDVAAVFFFAAVFLAAGFLAVAFAVLSDSPESMAFAAVAFLVVAFAVVFFEAVFLAAAFLAGDFFADAFSAVGFSDASPACGGPAGRDADRRRRAGALVGVSVESGLVVSTMRVGPFAGPHGARLPRSCAGRLGGRLTRQVWSGGRVGCEHVPLGAVLTVLFEGVTYRDPIGAEGALGLPRHLGRDRGAQARHAA